MTPDEADAALRTAIEQHAAAYGMGTPLLDSYAIVAAWMPESYNGTTHYTTSYSSPQIPSHVAIGLFGMGINFVMRGNDDD